MSVQRRQGSSLWVLKPDRCNRVPGQVLTTGGERGMMCMRSKLAQQNKMGWSSPGLAGQRHSENLGGNVVDGRNSRRGWKRAYREVGQNRQVGTELTKGRVWRIATSDRRMGHSRRKTKRYWKSAHEELKMGGRDVTRSLGAGDRRSVAAAVVATVDIGSRMVGDHREAYPGLWFRAGI